MRDSGKEVNSNYHGKLALKWNYNFICILWGRNHQCHVFWQDIEVLEMNWNNLNIQFYLYFIKRSLKTYSYHYLCIFTTNLLWYFKWIFNMNWKLILKYHFSLQIFQIGIYICRLLLQQPKKPIINLIVHSQFHY